MKIAYLLTFNMIVSSCSCFHMYERDELDGIAYLESRHCGLYAYRNGEGTGNYDGVGYGDGRATAEDAPYHVYPERYEGRNAEEILGENG